MHKGVSFWTIVQPSSAGHQQTSDVVMGFVHLTINFSWRANMHSEYEGDVLIHIGKMTYIYWEIQRLLVWGK